MSIQQQLNQWGFEKHPFVFLIDFECLKPMCWSLKEPIINFEYDFNGFTNIVKRNNLKKEFDKRSEIGQEKYGTTLKDNDTDDFLQHLKEELMDALLYIQKLQSKNKIN